MKIESSSQRREMHLFLTTNMAAVTLHANLQYFTITEKKKIIRYTKDFVIQRFVILRFHCNRFLETTNATF